MSMRERFEPRFFLADWLLARTAMVVALVVMGSMVLQVIGYQDPQFADRTMQWAMRISSAFWVILILEVWKERAPASREIMYLTFLFGGAAISVAGNFYGELYGGAIAVNFLMWIALFLGQLPPKQDKNQEDHE